MMVLLIEPGSASNTSTGDLIAVPREFLGEAELAGASTSSTIPTYRSCNQPGRRISKARTLISMARTDRTASFVRSPKPPPYRATDGCSQAMSATWTRTAAIRIQPSLSRQRSGSANA